MRRLFSARAAPRPPSRSRPARAREGAAATEAYGSPPHYGPFDSHQPHSLARPAASDTEAQRLARYSPLREPRGLLAVESLPANSSS
jgi:hypothetical protein